MARVIADVRRHMPAPVGYADLKMEQLDFILERDGELLVSLSDRHAHACIEFIQTIRTAQSWPVNRTPRLARIWPMLKGHWVTLRIMLAHSRLFELGRVIVLNTSSQTWERRADGNYLFKFSR
jgi:hypothetical protein